MNTTGTIGVYLQFKKDFIIKFAKVILPKEYFNLEFLGGFDENFSFFYDRYTLNKYDYEDLLIATGNYDKISEWFCKNNITDTTSKLLYLVLINNQIFETNENLEDYFIFISTIKLCLKIDKYINFKDKKNQTYSKVRKEVLQKFTNIPNKILILLKDNNKKLETLFTSVYKKNKNFIKNIYNNDIFKIDEEKIISKDDSNNMKLISLNYKIPGIKQYNHKDVDIVKKNAVVVNNLKKIEIEMATFDLFIKLVNKKPSILFINISEFLNANNIKYLKKVVETIKDNVVFIINYDLFGKYRDLINDLKTDDYLISFEKGKDNLDFKKLYKISYVWLKYENTIEYEKAIAEIKQSKAKVILYNIDKEDFLKSDINYYLESVKIC